MSQQAPVVATTPAPHGLVPKLLRYFTGSVVAWLAGAFPNFWLNRNWAWQRTGRPSLRHEVLPYAAIIVSTLVLATIATDLADRWLHQQGTSPSVRVPLVAAVFLGVYVVVFAVRFFLLERLFTRLPHPRHDGAATPDTSR